jgi:hypothetical protein
MVFSLVLYKIPNYFSLKWDILEGVIEKTHASYEYNSNLANNIFNVTS